MGRPAKKRRTRGCEIRSFMAMSFTRGGRRLSLLMLLVVALLAVAAPKEIDYDALEKAWAADDAPQEVRSHADDQYDRLNQMPPPQAKAMGPQMVFVTLQTHEPLSDLASRWKEMLWNGGVDVNIYEIEASKVLIGLQQGLFMHELRLFLHQQQEVVTYEWNSKTYSPDDAVEVDAIIPKNLPHKSKKPNNSKKKKRKTNRKAKTAAQTTTAKPTHDGL